MSRYDIYAEIVQECERRDTKWSGPGGAGRHGMPSKGISCVCR